MIAHKWTLYDLEQDKCYISYRGENRRGAKLRMVLGERPLLRHLHKEAHAITSRLVIERKWLKVLLGLPFNPLPPESSASSPISIGPLSHSLIFLQLLRRLSRFSSLLSPVMEFRFPPFHHPLISSQPTKPRHFHLIPQSTSAFIPVALVDVPAKIGSL